MLSNLNMLTMLVMACLCGVLLSYRFTVFAVALASPVLGMLAFLATGSATLGALVFVSVQVGYLAPIFVAMVSRYFFPVASGRGRIA